MSLSTSAQELVIARIRLLFCYDFDRNLMFVTDLKDADGMSNGAAPSALLVGKYVEMGFPKEMVLKGIKEIGKTSSSQFHLIISFVLFVFCTFSF